jgi:hypothetical protein
MIEISFWFMYDNHTFYKPVGDTLEEILYDLSCHAKKNPYGMICPVIVLKDGKEIKRIGNAVHIDGNGKAKDYDKWYDAIHGDSDIVNYYTNISIIKRKLLNNGIETDRDLVKLLNLSDDDKRLFYLWVDLQREYEKTKQEDSHKKLINTLISHLEKRIRQTETELERWRNMDNSLINVIISKGGKLRGFKEILNFIKQYK